MGATMVAFSAVLALLHFASSQNCLTRFSPENPEFATCKNRTCYIFLREEPYINLDEAVMQKLYTNRTAVFNCKDIPNRDIPGLGGTAFKVISRTAASSSACVWGGPKCQFNHMVDFIDKAPAPYRFAATGLLTESSDRIRMNVIPSKTLFPEALVIFGVDDRGMHREKFPLWLILHPFNFWTWVSLGATFAIVTFCTVVTAWCFGPVPFSFLSFATFIIHGYSDYTVAAWTPPPRVDASCRRTPEELEREYVRRIRKRLECYRLCSHLIRISLQVTFVIFLLFYEMAVAKHLFVKQSRPNLKDVSKLSEEKLKRYCLEKNTATEDIWFRSVYGYGRNDSKSVPWHRAGTTTKCFDWVLDKEKYPDNHTLWDNKPRPQFVVTFKSTGAYQVLKQSACQQMKIFLTNPALSQFGANWVHSSIVPEAERLAVDRDFGSVSLVSEMDSMAEKDADTLDSPVCTTVFRDIDVRVLGIVVLVVTVPFFIILFVLLVHFFLKMLPLSERFPSVVNELSRK